MTTNTAIWGAEKSQQTGLTGTVRGFIDAFARARSKHRTMAALAELDDNALIDIGLDPRDVRRSHRAITDWVVQSHSGTARLVLVGR
jgi:uncharacterized protein YjiS (DUF1127 family)